MTDQPPPQRRHTDHALTPDESVGEHLRAAAQILYGYDRDHPNHDKDRAVVDALTHILQAIQLLTGITLRP